ncbi:hypothetical protein RHGRI_034659 [Rhododendron griersonianum]|uniref:Uncharacterized protein n=1 Tax=Rhododendron griersonianum TaxID=479676 RepID=A0AAV6I756_9ERIC|nr:hypothetical protein RHGRI_034659 [Rhododendron griersonianum]
MKEDPDGVALFLVVVVVLVGVKVERRREEMVDLQRVDWTKEGICWGSGSGSGIGWFLVGLLYPRCSAIVELCDETEHGGRVNFMDLALLLAATSSSDDSEKLLELKRRIERYFGGDEEAIPSIFEAILKRKLAGKHDDSDDELMEEFGRKLANDVSDEEFDSEED